MTQTRRRRFRNSETKTATAVAIFATLVGQTVLGVMSDGATLITMGISQLVYLLPLILYAAWRRNHDGLWVYVIVGGVVFLVNAACWGLMMGGALG
ncbi:MAG: hypothetical protein OER88_00465 [Planctomycetota bacterium]|nr:hypothetical protein [Planctomycetota bacterium]